MKRTFFDQWHRITGLRVGLRPGVIARLHHYRDEPWYVLHQQSHAGYFRVAPAGYAFIQRLSPERSIDEIWREAVDRDPAQAPGQEEVFELVTALHRNNLLYVEGGVDEAKLIERHQRKKKKPWANRLSELLFMRIPLWDPERWLTRWQGLFARLWTWPMGLLAAAVMGWAVLEFMLAGSRVWTQATDILQLGNLLPLYLAIFVNHLLHEMAHAIACKHYGGQVRTMGFMLLLFTPLPYVDLSSSWTFRNRWQRAWVSSAGMATDLFVGALALWILPPLFALDGLRLDFGLAGLVTLLVASKIGDTCGYYVGGSIGKTHPFPRISPGKTTAGCVASLVGCVVVIGGLYLAGLTPDARYGVWGVLVGAAVVNLAAQAGDLLESWAKRKAGVKDSSTWFGPSGGLFDQVDSLLLTIPTAVLVWPFVFERSL